MSQAIPMTRVRPLSPSTSTRYAPVDPISDSPAQDDFPHVLSFDNVDDAKSIHQPWKRNLYILLEQPASSPNAFIVHVLTTSLIIISAVVTILETIPSFHSISPSIWFGLETSLVALFTIEYIARCVAHTGSWRSFLRWFASFFGIIDLLGILPYYLEIALNQDTSTFFRFTILRTFRLLRVFRPFRYNNTILLTIEVMYLSFRRSQHALLALAFFVVMVLIVFSTLLYFAERGSWDETLGVFINSDGDPSQFASIPAAGWFVIVTITTVGYGEITPRSFLGRLITVPLLVFGLLLIALPTFVLGREFSIVWESMQMDQNGGTEIFDAQMDRDVLASPLLTRRRSHQDVADGMWRRSSSGATPAPAAAAAPHEQQELSAQIAGLRETVEMQGALLRRLLERTEDGKRLHAQRSAGAAGYQSS